MRGYTECSGKPKCPDNVKFCFFKTFSKTCDKHPASILTDCSINMRASVSRSGDRTPGEVDWCETALRISNHLQLVFISSAYVVVDALWEALAANNASGLDILSARVWILWLFSFVVQTEKAEKMSWFLIGRPLWGECASPKLSESTGEVFFKLFTLSLPVHSLFWASVKHTLRLKC